jgi:hypothetical protein
MMRAALLAASLLLAAPSWAQEDQCRKAEAGSKKQLLLVLANLYIGSCLGRDNDGDALTAHIGKELSRQLTNDDPPRVRHSTQEQKMVVLWALGEVRDALTAARPRPGSVSAKTLESLTTAVERARTGVALEAPADARYLSNAVSWRWNPGTGRFTGGQADLGPLEAECVDEASAACKEAFETGKRALRSATLVERAFTFRGLQMLEEARIEAARRDRMWQAYFEQARVQLPQELAVNSLLYRQRARKEGGFAETPGYQVILLHPSAGLEYVRGAELGSRFEPALVLELAGINGWGWKSDGSMGTAYGASLALIYSDRAGAKGTGRGMVFHFNHRYSVAITQHGEKGGITLSTDLARLFTRVDENDRGKFRLGKN